MGITSSVVVALKASVYTGLSAESKGTLNKLLGGPQDTTKEGHVIFSEEHIKWYYDLDEDLLKFYEELFKFDSDDYLILEACHDYPNSEDGDQGSWHDNPWSCYKSVDVSLYWDIQFTMS